MTAINYKLVEIQREREKREELYSQMKTHFNPDNPVGAGTRVKQEDPYPFSQDNIIEELVRETEQDEHEIETIESTEEWMARTTSGKPVAEA